MPTTPEQQDHIEGVGGAAWGNAHTTPPEEERNATVPDEPTEPEPETTTTTSTKKASST